MRYSFLLEILIESLVGIVLRPYAFRRHPVVNLKVYQFVVIFRGRSERIDQIREYIDHG